MNIPHPIDRDNPQPLQPTPVSPVEPSSPLWNEAVELEIQSAPVEGDRLPNSVEPAEEPKRLDPGSPVILHLCLDCHYCRWDYLPVIVCAVYPSTTGADVWAPTDCPDWRQADLDPALKDIF